MIVDEADLEMEMATDPFIEAGIEVPANLPYQATNQQEESYKKVLGDDAEENFLADRIRKMSARNKVVGEDNFASATSFDHKNNVNVIHLTKDSQPALTNRKPTIR